MGFEPMTPGTKLKKRLARDDPGNNRLDRIANAYSPAKYPRFKTKRKPKNQEVNRKKRNQLSNWIYPRKV